MNIIKITWSPQIDRKVHITWYNFDIVDSFIEFIDLMLISIWPFYAERLSSDLAARASWLATGTDISHEDIPFYRLAEDYKNNNK